MNDSQLQALEALGPEAVGQDIARGRHGTSGSENRGAVEAWLQAKRDAAASESLRIAISASRNARRANIIAIIALIWPTLMMAIIWMLKKFT